MMISSFICSSSSDIALTSVAEHQIYFFNLLKMWCTSHKDEFMSDSFDLKEGKDFILNILYDQDNNLHASVKCSCSRTITMKDGKIQLSNFQKHLRSTNCSHIKAIKKMNGEQKIINQQQLTDSSSSAPIQQQFASQIPISSSAGGSSVVGVVSADIQPLALQKKST